MSSYLRRLRDVVGHELLVLPSVAVLPWDDAGRLLLVREAQTGLWQTIGGAVEPDESPLDAALREAAEEAGVAVRIERIRGVVGGPQFRVTYPNDDVVSYVSTVSMQVWLMASRTLTWTRRSRSAGSRTNS